MLSNRISNVMNSSGKYSQVYGNPRVYLLYLSCGIFKVKIYRRLPLLLLPILFTPLPAWGQSWQEWVKQNSKQPSQQQTNTPASGNNLPSQPRTEPFANPGTTPPTAGITTQSAVFKASFMQGCVLEPRFQDYCQCALTQIQNSYTIDEFYKINQYIQDTRQMPSEVESVILACVSKL